MRPLVPLLFLVTTFSVTAHAQGFGATGANWYYSAHANGGCPGNCEYIHFESAGDTVISGQLAKRIASSYHRIQGDTLRDELYLYQEADTLFIWNDDRDMFLRTYIFNALVGDTLLLDSPVVDEWTDSISKMVVTEVVEVEVNGIALKRYLMEPTEGWSSFYMATAYMDRIGGLHTLLPNAPSILEAPGPIRCYSDAEIDTSFQDVPCDQILHLSTDEMLHETAIQVFPNPTHGLLNVRSEHRIARLAVFDLTGRLVTSAYTRTIDLSYVPHGQYVMRIQFSNGLQTEKSILKGR